MINTIYVEQALEDDARAQRILARFPDVTQVICERYGEVFNPKAQNFRLQKSHPALVLAEKFGETMLLTP
ncbi:MAG TPA: DNA photolyase, partial [Gammaproteobacteria bacterium]|nr:DNA photolyase [Gammaproteobacteria bacterium]